MDNDLEQFAEELREDIANGKLSQWAEVYALDAVSEEERTTIEEYISATTEDARRDFQDRVRQARETIALVYATHEADPPADLLERIMEQLPTGGAASSVEAAPVATGVDQLAARRHRKQSRPSTARRWIIGAAAAAVLALGSVTVVQNLAEPSVQQQVAQASDVHSATIEIPAGGTAQIERSDSVNAAVVTLRNVPAPAVGKVYQMWRLPADGSAPESVGTMSGADVAESKTTVLEGIEPYSALAITVEPEGGSQTPTMPIVAQIPLDA